MAKLEGKRTHDDGQREINPAHFTADLLKHLLFLESAKFCCLHAFAQALLECLSLLSNSPHLANSYSSFRTQLKC